MSSNAAASGDDAAGTGSAQLTTDHNVLTDFTTPMFQSIDPSFDPQQHNNNVDLDDLFRECYFMDFPVPASFTEGGDATTTNQAGGGGLVPLPQISSSSELTNNSDAGNTIVVASPTPAPPVAAAVAPAPTPMPVVSLAAKATGAGTLKRTADDMSAGEEVLTEQQRLERRERNREHAKRSRLRKKFLLESLQEQIQGLQEQIEAFKDIITKELPDKAEQLFQTICGDKTKFTPLPMPSGFGPVKTLMEPDFRLMSALSGSQQNFAISDPSLPDNPIVYCSQGFLELTGYTLDQVLGRNCRFLQGPGTDQSAVEVIRKGINEGVDTSVCLLNYKADGTPFWNQFFVAALRDAENNVVNYVGVQCEVSKAVVEKHLGERAAKK